MNLPKFRHVDIHKPDLSRVYLGKEKELRFLALPPVVMTREEFEQMYPNESCSYCAIRGCEGECRTKE